MSNPQATANQFEELLAELQGEQEALAKALPADDGDGDEKVAAAAAEGGSQEPGEPDGDEDGEVPGDADGDEPKMAKSFQVTLADGTTAEAVDATELVKSLQNQVGALAGRVDQHDAMAKALTQTLELVKGQAGLIKSLQEKVVALSGTGRGRKTTLVVTDKPNGEPATMAKSQAAEPTAAEFLVKSNAAFEAGKLSGLELTSIDVALRSGTPVPASLIQKVMSA